MSLFRNGSGVLPHVSPSSYRFPKPRLTRRGFKVFRGGEARLPRAIDPALNIDGVVEAGVMRAIGNLTVLGLRREHERS